MQTKEEFQFANDMEDFFESKKHSEEKLAAEFIDFVLPGFWEVITQELSEFTAKYGLNTEECYNKFYTCQPDYERMKYNCQKYYNCLEAMESSYYFTEKAEEDWKSIGGLWDFRITFRITRNKYTSDFKAVIEIVYGIVVDNNTLHINRKQDITNKVWEVLEREVSI